MAEVDVLLTPREAGGHETALLTWLADAARYEGLRPRLLLPPGQLHEAVHEAGLASFAADGVSVDSPRHALQALLNAPRCRPLLLAPGVLHAQAWLLAAGVLARRPTWAYVPSAHSAVAMGYRFARLRDRLLRPLLHRASGFIAISDEHAHALRQRWQVRAPVLALPNRAALRGAVPVQPPPAADGRLRVAFVGRFDLHSKGLDWLAATLREDATLAGAAHWRFQGRGSGETLLHTLAAALGPHQVQVDAFAPIEQALARCDVLLLPSRYEGVPLVALEATACGWPVLASDRAGLTGILPASSVFTFGDRTGLGAALASLGSESARRAAVEYTRRRLDEHWPDSARHRARAAVVRALRHSGSAS